MVDLMYRDIQNIERLELEVGFEFKDIPKNYGIFLEENGLEPLAMYNPASKTNLKGIYKSALGILESIANNPQQMKNYKTEDISITHFHTNLMNRIDDLRKKINTMVTDELTSENDARIVPFIW